MIYIYVYVYVYIYMCIYIYIFIVNLQIIASQNSLATMMISQKNGAGMGGSWIVNLHLTNTEVSETRKT